MNPLIQEKISLAPYTSWLVGGSADFFCLPTSVEQLQEALLWAKNEAHPVAILGGGSNVLISDQGIMGLTICLKNLSGVIVEEEQPFLKLNVLSGTSKSELLKIFLKYKLSPALFLAGIPGDVGGGVVMNAGVAEQFTPREFCELTDWIEVLKPDGSFVRIGSDDINWSYRHSSGWRPGVITRVGLKWENQPDVTIMDRVREANKTRLLKQPLDMPSCGSVFKNPQGYRAAQLVDRCGLKGFAVGGAQVSTKHANFIVNTGKATAKDIWMTIQHVQRVVLQAEGIQLQTEVVRMGEW